MMLGYGGMSALSPHGPLLPDEILMEIFSRLPAKYVVRCGRVCRRWKSLISTQYFAVLHYHYHHHQNAGADTVVLFEEASIKKDLKSFFCNPFWVSGKGLHSFDEGWKRQPPKNQLTIRRSIQCLNPDSEYTHLDDGNNDGEIPFFMSFSSCGMAVFHRLHDARSPSSHCVILNPITGEKVDVVLTPGKPNTDMGKRRGRGLAFGLFLHPVIGEFCLLWGQLVLPERHYGCTNMGEDLEFKLINLGPSKSCWRDIPIKFADSKRRPIQAGLEYRHQPRVEWPAGPLPPVLTADGFLYWIAEVVPEAESSMWLPGSCAESILSFDIERELFDLLPHPGPCCKSRDEAVSVHCWMKLLQHNGGHLSLCQCSATSFTIWVLDDDDHQINHEQQQQRMWVQTHVVQHWIVPEFFRSGFYRPIFIIQERHGVQKSLLSSSKEDYFNPCFTAHFQPIGVLEGDLLLVHWFPAGLFVHDLKLGTARLFEISSGKRRGMVSGGLTFRAHNHSFLPIRGIGMGTGSNHSHIIFVPRD